jgi:murein peptide amidase A
MQNILDPVPGEARSAASQPHSATGTQARRGRSLADLLAPLDQIAADSPNLVANRGARFEVGGESYEIPRYMFVGPRGGGVPIRVGFFAAIHGDEPEGAHAIVQFVKLLEARPELALGYCLSIYPVCNPTGFEDDTTRSRGGHDLNAEFWKKSPAPEVRILQAELVSHSFDGIVSLRTHGLGSGLYGAVRSRTLASQLLRPALKAGGIFLPLDDRPFIDGLPAQDGIVREAAKGALSVPPGVHPRPFEITLETPKAPPAYLKEFALAMALRTILVEYRKFIAYAPNL